MSDDRTLHEVARVYQEAAGTDGKPAAAVQRQLNLPTSTADHLIRKAKDAGLIDRNMPRNNPKIVAVAKRLGVSPDALREAVLEVANGDLRVIRVQP